MPLRLPTINLSVSVTYPKQVVPLTLGTICVFFLMCRMSQYRLFRGGCCSGFWRRFFRRSEKPKLVENIEEEDDGPAVENIKGEIDEQLGPAENDIKYLQEKEKIQSLERQLQAEKEENKNLHVLLDKQISEIEIAVQRQKEEEIAKQEALTRLSEQISLKLADNNPNIADLSDANRPTNLADKFSMLYDDEWTEAFDALQNIPEFQEDEQAIKQLLEILMVCYTICRDQSARQMTSMFSINDLRIPDDQIPTDMRKLIKEKRKKYAGIYLPCLYDMIIASLKKQCDILPEDNAIEAYIKRCTELCWLMAVQDPPMAILTDESKDGKFDKTKFKEYTKTGPYVDFIVWPAVLIQEGGDMMAKGVVQCKDKLVEADDNFQTEKAETIYERSTKENKEVFDKETADMELQNKQSATTASGEETKYKLESSESNETDLQGKEKMNAMSAIETVEPKQEDGNMMTKRATQCNDRAIKLNGEYQTDKIKTNNGSSTQEKKGVNENETADNAFQNEQSTTSISTVKEKLQSKEFESKETDLQQTQDMKAYSAIENNNEQSDNHEPHKPRQEQDSHVQVGSDKSLLTDNDNRKMNDPQDHANDSSGKTQETENLRVRENDTGSSIIEPRFDQTYETNNVISKTDTLNRDGVHVAVNEYKVSEGIQDPVSTDNGNYEMNDIQDHTKDSIGETNETSEAENFKETKHYDGASLTEPNIDNKNQIEEANIGIGKPDSLDHDQISENNNKSEGVPNATESGKVTDGSGLTSQTEEIKTPTNASKDSTIESTYAVQLLYISKEKSEGISDIISAPDINDDLIAKEKTLSNDEPVAERKSSDAGDKNTSEPLSDSTGNADSVAQVNEDNANDTEHLNQNTIENTEHATEILTDDKAANNEASNNNEPSACDGDVKDLSSGNAEGNIAPSTEGHTTETDNDFETESSATESGETRYRSTGDEILQANTLSNTPEGIWQKEQADNEHSVEKTQEIHNDSLESHEGKADNQEIEDVMEGDTMAMDDSKIPQTFDK